MALTKVGSGGIENITNAANATFLTIDASEQITVASEGGAVTTSVQQGLCKSWFKFNQDTPAINDSFNISTITDNSTGNHNGNFTNNMSNVNYANTAMKQAELTNADCAEYTSGSNSTSAVNRIDVENNAFRDAGNTNTLTFGDLA